MTPFPRFRLSFPGATTALLRDLLQRAVSHGVRDRVSLALLAIESRLRSDPVGWGDPVRYYAAIEMTAYRRVHDELRVMYSVHDARPEVWLLDVTPVLSHPLRQG